MKNYEIYEHRDIDTYKDLPEHATEGVKTCIASAFGGRIADDDAHSHMQGHQILIATHRTEFDDLHPETVGFSSTSINSPYEQFDLPGLSRDQALYFAGAAIARHHQGEGLYGMLNERRFDFAFENDLDLIYTRTQNPRVEEGITNSIQKLIDKRKIQSYKMARFITIGAYGKMLTRDKPVAKSLTYDDINYDRGDAAVITWQLER